MIATTSELFRRSPRAGALHSLAWGSAGLRNLGKEDGNMRNKFSRSLGTLSAIVAIALLAMALPLRLAAQDQDRRRSPGTRRAPRPHGRIRFFSARRRKRVGRGCAQPSNDHWRQAVGRPRFARRSRTWTDDDPPQQQHGILFYQSRRPNGADPTQFGSDHSPCASIRSRRRHGSRYPQPGIFYFSARPIPSRSQRRWNLYRDHGAGWGRRIHRQWSNIYVCTPDNAPHSAAPIV